ncbi:MAG: GDSL-type esterase/lipase family protein [Thermomicrobium sp.]|nr:GDSL-type esterase/lipase family protein [Thermomicrobium sp.]
MKHRLVVLLVLLAAVLVDGGSFGHSSAAPPALCVAVGDSLAAGIGSTLPRERSAAALLCQWSQAYFGEQAELVSLAVPGETTRSFLEGSQLDRLRATMDAARRQGRAIRFVLVSLGGNDLLALADRAEAERERAYAQFETDLAAALTAVRAAIGQTPLLMLTPYDLTEGDADAVQTDSWWVGRFAQAIRVQATAVGGTVVDLARGFRGHIAEWTWWPVDVHPTNDGYMAIARLAWRALGWDREAPRVTVVLPTEGAVIVRRYATVRVRVDDPGGIESVTLWVDGQEIGTLDPLPEEGEWITLWETPWPMAGPPILVEVRAADRAGNVGEASVQVRLPGG